MIGDDRFGKEEAVQPNPSPPAPPPLALVLPEGVPAADNNPFRQTPVLAKLKILARCHEAAQQARRKGRTLLAALAVGVPLGVLAGIGVFFAVYDDPSRYIQRYQEMGGFITHYVKGRQVSQQEYDYFRATAGNTGSAVAGAIAAGLGVSLFVLVVFLFVKSMKNMPVSIALEEQIEAILKGHPDAIQAWGGPSVLRQPELVHEVLNLVEAGKG